MFATRDLLEPSLTLFIWAYMLLANGASIRASGGSIESFVKSKSEAKRLTMHRTLRLVGRLTLCPRERQGHSDDSQDACVRLSRTPNFTASTKSLPAKTLIC